MSANVLLADILGSGDSTGTRHIFNISFYLTLLVDDIIYLYRTIGSIIKMYNYIIVLFMELCDTVIFDSALGSERKHLYHLALLIAPPLNSWHGFPGSYFFSWGGADLLRNEAQDYS